MFHKMPLVLIAVIVLTGLLNPWIPENVQSTLFATSLSIKSVIVFVLPLLIFGLLFKTAVHLSKKASKVILFMIGAICASNFLSTMISYIVGTFVYQLDMSIGKRTKRTSIVCFQTEGRSPVFAIFANQPA